MPPAEPPPVYEPGAPQAPEPSAPAPASAPAPELVRAPFVFSGSAGEYFRIWIVNLCLTVVTLGIYSAWAKVRTRRYFYQNTLLDGSGFEYTAEPLKILIGRLIVLAFGLVYALAGQISLTAGLVMLGLLVVATPWMAVRSLAFNHRNSRWRGIRFKFLGSYREAAKVFLAMPLMVMFSFGLAAPYHHGRQHQFLVANTAFGQSRAEFGWVPGPYYVAYFIALGLVFLGGIAAVGLVAGVAAVSGSGPGYQEASPEPGIAMIGATMFVYFAIYGLAAAAIYARTTNLKYGFAAFPGLRLHSSLTTAGILGLYLKCGLVVLLTAGLAVPWAAVAIARYRADHLEVEAEYGFDHFSQAEEDAHGLGAIADEAAVGFDFDFGL